MNLKQKISNFMKTDYRTLNCGFMINTYAFTPVINKTGLKAYYNYAETSGNLLNHSPSGDSIGSSGDLTTGGTITKSANDWNFSSTDGNAIETTTSILAGTHSAWTMNIWFKPASVRASYMLCFTANDGNTNNFCSINTEAGGTMLGSVSGVGGTQITISSSTNYSTSTMQMVTVVYDGSLSGAARLKIYYNGTSEGTASGTPDATYTLTTYPSVAKQGNSGQAFYTGHIYDTSLWSRALSSTEITTLYNGGTILSLL